jgi:hypothetical protein
MQEKALTPAAECINHQAFVVCLSTVFVCYSCFVCCLQGRSAGVQQQLVGEFFVRLLNCQACQQLLAKPMDATAASMQRQQLGQLQAAVTRVAAGRGTPKQQLQQSSTPVRRLLLQPVTAAALFTGWCALP